MTDHLQVTDAGHSVKEQQVARRKWKRSFVVEFCDAAGNSNTSAAILMAFKNVLGGGGQS